jgi:hypothetical protein
MERISNLSIHHLLVLNEYFKSICTEHYPKEIVHIIIATYYRFFIGELRIKNIICTPENEKFTNLIRKQEHNYQFKMERLKILLLVKKVREILLNNSSSKVILVIDFINNRQILEDNLQEFGPVSMYSYKESRKDIDKFQQPNMESRIFIGGQRLFTGFMLNDETGNFPRFMFSMANYGYNNQNLIGRIMRYDTLGIATFYFFWSGEEEFKFNRRSSDDLDYPIEYFPKKIDI